MEVLKDGLLFVSLVANAAAIGKYIFDGRRARREDDEKRMEKEKQAAAEAQLSFIVKTLQKPETRGLTGVVFNADRHAGAELGVEKGMLVGQWHNGQLWVRFATFTGEVEDAPVDEDEDDKESDSASDVQPD